MNAGTGKSTLVKHIIAALQIPEEYIVYTAYTGKATLVLSQKGCKNTCTLHKLLYNARLNPRTGSFSFFPRQSLEFPYKIVVIDEVSMLSMEMWNLLKKHRIHILALGDPGQLGPVKSNEDSALLKNPHIFLDEIMRQEEGNEIIQLSMNIRKGWSLRNQLGKHVQVLNKNELTTGMLKWADQILCAKNVTRVELNNQMREMLGHGKEPKIGDKIICLRNYWDEISEVEFNPLVNGTIGWITGIEKVYSPQILNDVLKISFETELGDIYNNITVDYHLLTNNVPSLNKNDFIRLSRNERTRAFIPKEFAYGYAITVHKSQGSEWDNVLLIEENFPWEIKEHQRHLYTGITRASSKIVIVKK